MMRHKAKRAGNGNGKQLRASDHDIAGGNRLTVKPDLSSGIETGAEDLHARKIARIGSRRSAREHGLRDQGVRNTAAGARSGTGDNDLRNVNRLYGSSALETDDLDPAGVRNAGGIYGSRLDHKSLVRIWINGNTTPKRQCVGIGGSVGDG